MKANTFGFLLPRLRDILSMAIFAAAWIVGPRMLSLDSDLGRHLALGNYVLDTHYIPTHDLFSFTRADDARPPYEWLTQTLFATANRLAGLDGVLAVTALIIAAAFLFTYINAVRRSGWALTSLLVVTLAAAASSLHWLPRPHVVTFLLLAIWQERLERVRRGEDVPLWSFPALMLVWANAHGGFIFGILAWLAYFGGWIWQALKKTPNAQNGKAWILIGASSLLASFLTPSGWGNWQAVLSNNSRYILSRTVETMPPDFSQPSVWPFILLLFFIVLAVYSTLATHKPFPPAHLFLLAGFALLGLVMARNIPLFAIIAAPILAEWFSSVGNKTKWWNKFETNIAALEAPLRGAAWPIALGLGFALWLGIRFEVQKEAWARFDTRVFPVAAADWLVEHPQSGNMFNEINWGGYLLYRLWPPQKVFIDSQTDFYGEALVRDYEQTILARENWKTIFQSYKVEWVILSPSTPLVQALKQAGWVTLYEDKTASVLRRLITSSDPP